MKPDNVLSAKNRNELRQWLEHNHLTEKECWVAVKRGRPTSDDVFWYVDAVEEALCFGWIDSTTKTLQDGVTYQKLAPRKKGSLWSELNKERCRRMDKLGMMTEYGRSNFQSFPELYQRVRIDTIQIKKKQPKLFLARLQKLIDNTRNGVMYGEWNDNGRLLNY